MSTHDELTAAACLATQQLKPIKKAKLLPNTTLALNEDGLYGDETYLGVCLKTPGLPKEDMKKAQSNAWKSAGERLQLGPSNGQVQSELSCKEIHFLNDPASQRIPPEIWDQVAAQTPRYHLRNWLFVSPLHRDVASRYLFTTLHIGFHNLEQGLDILERAISDPVFASQVKSLHLELYYEEGDAWDVIARMLNMSLRSFKALRHLEWVGHLEIPGEMVKVLSQKPLHGLGFKEWQFDSVSVSAFHSLRKFAFHVNEDDDLEDIRTVLDLNESTLKHLTLGGCSFLGESLDPVFESGTINNLTHLELFGSEVSGFVLDCIIHVPNLQSLAFHGSFEEPAFAIELFVTDYNVDGRHVFLPHLESFGLDMEDQDEDLYYSAMQFLRKREKLRRLDLGSCSWYIVQDICPGLSNLRVLAVCIEDLSQEEIKSFVEALPMQMVAIRLSVIDSEISLDEYPAYFTRFSALSFLHLEHPEQHADTGISEKDFQMQTDKSLRSIAAAVPSLDFLAWHSKLYVIVRSHGDVEPNVELREIPTNSNLEYGSGVDLISEDIAWLQKMYQWE